MDRAKRRRLEYNRDLRWSASLRMGNHWVVDDDGILTVYREGKRGLLVPLPWEPATLEAAANLIEAYLETEGIPPCRTRLSTVQVNVAVARRQKRLTQAELAKGGIHRLTVVKIESGSVTPARIWLSGWLALLASKRDNSSDGTPQRSSRGGSWARQVVAEDHRLPRLEKRGPAEGVDLVHDTGRRRTAGC